MRHSSSRFSLIDVLAILFIVLVYTAVFLPTARALDEKDARIKCASHLKQIGMAMLLYSNENRGAYPRTRWNGDDPKPVFFTNPDLKNPFDKKQGPVNDVTAAAFLLLRNQDIASDVFICPDTKAVRSKVEPLTHSNFASPENLSYSFSNPYPSKEVAKKGFVLNNAMSPEFALAADLNPGMDDLLKVTAHSKPEELHKVCSLNHRQEGQNTLYADGHVEYWTSPFCGIEKDNIYTFGESGDNSGGKGIVGAAAHPTDSVLLPTAEEGKDKL